MEVWWLWETEIHLDPDPSSSAQPDRNLIEIRKMFCAHQVFRCFKFIEKLGERLVGAVGPYFVAAASGLISVGAVCFCTYDSSSTTAPGLFIEPLGRMCQSKLYRQRYLTLGSRPQYPC